MKHKIAVFGPTCLDHSIVVQDPISLDGSSRIAHERKDLGGTGVCYALALSRLGNEVTLFSKVGSDPEADFIKDKIKIEKNLCPVWQVNRGGTDYSYILLDNGNHKTVASKKTASTTWKPIKDYASYLHNINAVIITSFPNEIALSILKFIKQNLRHKPLILWAPHLNNCREAKKMQRFFNMIDHISLSLEEFDELSSAVGNPHFRGIKSLTVTNGKNGCTLMTPKKTARFSPYKALENPLDSNGAGEAFGSAFISSFLATHNYSLSVKTGSLFAYLHIQRPASDFPRLSLHSLLKRIADKSDNSPNPNEIYG